MMEYKAIYEGADFIIDKATQPNKTEFHLVCQYTGQQVIIREVDDIEALISHLSKEVSTMTEEKGV